MSELKITRLSDIPDLSEAEIKARLNKEKAEYRKMLHGLCPSKETRQKARRASKRMNACDTCVYCDGESAMCWYPHSDLYIEDLDIDPCYEGVLRYLVKEAEDARQKEERAYMYEVTAALIDAPACLQRAMLLKHEVILVLTEYLLDWADKNEKPSEADLETVRELRESTKKVLPLFDYLLGSDDTP